MLKTIVFKIIMGSLNLTRLAPNFVTISLAKSIALLHSKAHTSLNENLFKILTPESNRDFSFCHHASQYLFIVTMLVLNASSILLLSKKLAQEQGNAFCQ